MKCLFINVISISQNSKRKKNNKRIERQKYQVDPAKTLTLKSLTEPAPEEETPFIVLQDYLNTNKIVIGILVILVLLITYFCWKRKRLRAKRRKKRRRRRNVNHILKGYESDGFIGCTGATLETDSCTSDAANL